MRAISPSADAHGSIPATTWRFSTVSPRRGRCSKELRRLLRARGLLISANLTHGGAEAYLAALQDKKTWLTAFIDEERETALSIKL